MSSLADLPELIGFFSYSREDDADSHGALSALRNRIQGELRGQLGRTAKTFRLWQDKEAIASGTLWESEIRNAVEQSVFFIPIITPTVVASPHCRFELDSFLAREEALGRIDLVFPILYIDVPALENIVRQQNDPVLSLIAKRQYVDWREFRYLDVHSTDVKKEVGRFCTDIRDALLRPWLSPEERKQQEQAGAQQRAEEDKKREAAEAASRAAESRRNAVEAQARERVVEERRQREAEEERKGVEAARRRTEDERRRTEAEAKRQADEEERRRLRRSEARLLWALPRPALAVGSLLGLTVLGAIGMWLVFAWPTPITVKALSAQQERALKPKDTFKECSNCPEMVVVPVGSFAMGSPAGEPGRNSNEGPQHMVTIANPLAVAKFELTFDEWDACVSDGGCNNYRPADYGWGRGHQPVIYVSWNDADAYVAWISRKTGKPYRLLSEAEREYVTRAGTTTPFWWGSSISTAQANYNGNYTYGSGVKGEYRARTLPIDSFEPNPFGLYQVHGNVWEWTEDCYNAVDYSGAPTSGAAWIRGNCDVRFIRGGSWLDDPGFLRSANRSWEAPNHRANNLGFRVGRTLVAAP